MMHFNPYIEDSDDWLANQGQLQIVLLFLASLVLFVKTMPEQEGAPGNLFRGPLFAAVMVCIGTMTLVLTIYALLVEHLNIKSAKDHGALFIFLSHQLCGNQNFTARRPPRHRRNACSMAWRCRFLTARPSQDGRVIAEK